MRRPLAAVLGSLAIPFGLLTQSPLATVALVGTGVLLLAHAATGLWPKPRLSPQLELFVVVAAVASVARVNPIDDVLREPAIEPRLYRRVARCPCRRAEQLRDQASGPSRTFSLS